MLYFDLWNCVILTFRWLYNPTRELLVCFSQKYVIKNSFSSFHCVYRVKRELASIFRKYEINIFLFKIFSEFLHEFGRLSRLWILMILDVPLALQIKTRISFTYSDTWNRKLRISWSSSGFGWLSKMLLSVNDLPMPLHANWWVALIFWEM